MAIQPPDLTKIDAELCRRSFYYFIQFFWDTVIAEAPVWNWHIKYIADLLQGVGERVARREAKQYDYEIINVPPGSSKSTIISEMYPLWCWTIDPTQRFICASYASTPAEDIAGKCFNIYNSEKFKRLFPHLHGRMAEGGKTNFKNGLMGERYTTSTGSTITGIHAHQIIGDDLMNPQAARSKLERTTANRFISETLSSRKVDDNITPIILVMQRLHEMDCTGYILKMGDSVRIRHTCIPVELSPDVRPASLAEFYKDGLFDPVRRPRERLAILRTELGSYGYAGQMMQRPSPAEGGILKKEWFPVMKNRIGGVVHFQIDPAYTANTDNDPTAVTAYIRDGENILIIHSCSVYKEFPEFIKWLPGWVAELGYTERSKIHVEPKASGLSIIQQLRSTTNLNIIIDEAPKDDKISRANDAAPKVEAGRVRILEGRWNESFLDQVAAFPNSDHDDEVDNLTAIVRRELLKSKGVPLNTLAGMLR